VELLGLGGHTQGTGSEVQHFTVMEAWNFSVSAVTLAINLLETTVAGLERAPARPILELFRMGLWPIGGCRPAATTTCW